MDKLLKTKNAAALVDLGADHFLRLYKEGKIPLKPVPWVSDDLRWSFKEIQDWIEKRKQREVAESKQ